MKEKRPIDTIRDSSGHAEVGTDLDGAIVEMKAIGGKLIIIKERSLYEMSFADDIDPERTNINLPPTIHKLIIDKGADSEIVAKTFLTAKTIFNKDYIRENINCDAILSLVIDILSELSILEKEIKEYQEEEDKVSLEYEQRRVEKRTYQLPSVINLETRCKTIFQKADHIEQIIMEIIIHFYPKGLTKQSHFPMFQNVLKTLYGETDGFVKFIGKTLYFMRAIRELRNGFDHRLSTIKIVDFELQKDGNVLSPTIELSHKEIKLERTSLSEFLKVTTENLIEIIEVSFAFLASKNVRKTGMHYQIREIPDDKRRYKFVKYSFWTPIGDEGFYCQ